jgi:hypothetical protein
MGEAAMSRIRLALLAGALLLAAGLVVGWLLAPPEDERAAAPAGSPPAAVAAAPELPRAAAEEPTRLPELAVADVHPIAGAAALANEQQRSFSGRIVDERGAPVAGASVELVRNAAVPGLDVDGSAAVLARVASGADGCFAFAARESLTRIVTPPGPRREPLFALLRASAPGVATAVVRLAPSAFGDTDLGDVRLARGGRLRGRVVDAEGHPVEGARVLCQHEEPGGEFGALAQQLEVAQTVADGGFALAGVRAGRCWLRVEAEGRGRMVTAPITLMPGADEDLGTLTWQASLSLHGAVLDAAGVPLTGVEVSLELRVFGSRDVQSRTVTGAGGLFEFRDIDRGRTQGLQNLQVIADAKDLGSVQRGVELPLAQDLLLRLAPVARLHVRATDADERPAQGSLRLVSSGEELARAELRDGEAELPVRHDGLLLVTAEGCAPQVKAVKLLALPEGGLVLRLPRESVVRGRALGPAGEPAPGLVVSALPWRGDLEPVGFLASALTDDAGRFELRGLAAGDWALRAERAPWGSARLGLALAAAEQQEAELRFEPGGTVAGRVHDARGTPRAGITVLVGPISGRGPRTLSDADGRFTLAGLPPGPTILSAREAPSTVSVTIVAGQTAQADLLVSGGVAIAGLVRSGGVGVPGARLRLTQGAGRAPDNRTSDEQGQFRFDGLPAGAWHLELRRDDSLLRAASDLNLADGEERWLELDLSGTTLVVTARRAEDQAPLPGARLRLSDAGGHSSGERTAGADGALRFDDLPAGHVVLEAVADGRLSVQRELDIAPGRGVVPLDVALGVAARLEITARALDGSGFVVAVVVSALPGGGELRRTNLATAGGAGTQGAGVARAAVDHLAPGRVRVALVQTVRDRPGSVFDFNAPTHPVELTSRELELASGQVAPLDFEIQPVQGP